MRRIGVYPRVGGGTLVDFSKGRTRVGLSPRGRGNHRCRFCGTFSWGSIPAWAGEPSIAEFQCSLC